MRTYRKPSEPYILQIVSGKAVHVVKKAPVDLTLRRSGLTVWMFVTDITNEMSRGYAVRRWILEPRATTGPRRTLVADTRSTATFIESSLVSDEMIPVACQIIVTAQLADSVEATNALRKQYLAT